MNSDFEYREAVNAEIFDFEENRRNEDHFLISGLAKPPSGLTSKEWQVKVQQDVGSIISLILGREGRIRYVQNQTGTQKQTLYLVRMCELRDAQEIRSKFGHFFAGGKDARPFALKGLNFHLIKISPIINWCFSG